MKKLLVGLIAVLGLSSMASAQTYVGARLGFPFGIQFGVDNALGPNLGFRAAANFYYFSTPGIQLDALARSPLDATVPGLSAYYGGGLFGYFGYVGPAATYPFTVGIEGVLGLEYAITPQVSIFADVAPGYAFTGFTGFNANGAVGLNFRF